MYGPNGADLYDLLGSTTPFNYSTSFTLSDSAIGPDDYMITSGSFTMGGVSVDLTGENFRVVSAGGPTTMLLNVYKTQDFLPSVAGNELFAFQLYMEGSSDITNISQLSGYASSSAFANYSFVSSDYLSGSDAMKAGTSVFDVSTSPVSGGGLGAGALPEPATWAMMILGIGAAGYRLRRRRVSYRPTKA